MKKKGNRSRPAGGWQKLFRIMKLSMILLFVGLMQVTATVYSQTTKLSIDAKNQKVSDVLKSIEDQSEFRFFYKNEQVDATRKVNIVAEKKSIEEILETIFEGTEVSYTFFEDKLILLSSKEKMGSEIKGMQQQKSVSGKITDENGDSLPGVSVIIKGSTLGTVSDADGNYFLSEIPEDAIIQFSFIGMMSQEVKLENQSLLNITMRTDAIGIEEVVAIGYGTVKKGDLTGSVSTISTKDIERIPATNPLDALQGRATGINITSNSGMPGESAEVLIRGIQSINGINSPIYVVDGLITSGINNINPSDIQSVSVLKDASATAIYGARAANGVIVVTTKRGSNTGEPQITFNSYVGVQTQSNLKLDLLNADEFLEIYNESYENAGIEPSWTEEDLKYYEGVDTDWMDAVMQTGTIQNYNLGVAGSSAKSNYYISGSYVNNRGMLIESDYEKYTLRLNSDHVIRDWMHFGHSIMLYASDRNGDADVYELATRKVPITRIYGSDGSYGIINSTALEHMHANPVWMAKESINNTKYKGLKGNIYLTFDLAEGLEFTTRQNMEWIYRYSTSFTPGLNPLWNWEGSTINSVSKSSSQQKHLTTDFLLNYNKTFLNDHVFKVLAGYSIEEYSTETLSGYRENTPNNTIQFLDAGDPDTQINSNGYTDWSFISVFGRLNYTFKNKYMLTATIRRDGTSRLSEGNRNGIFPSASVAWRISQEKFLSNLDILDDMKIRASWGTVGNVQSISEYGTIAALTQYNYVFNDAPFQGYTLTTAVNKDLQWETTEKKNLGVDAILFDNQFYTNIDFFIEDTKDLLFRDPIAYSTGLSGSPYINAGKVRNTGFELLLGLRKKVNADWSYDLSLNASHVKNEVLNLEGRDFSTSGIIEGYPVASFYGYQSNGLIYSQEVLENNPHQSGKSLGDIWIKDVDGKDENGNLTGKPDGSINSADRGIIGNKYPDLVYGLMGTINYKNWSFQVQLQGVHGIDKRIHSGEYTNAFHYFTHWAMNHEASILDRYHPNKNPNGKMPQVSTADKGHNFDFSDFWLKDASYLRVKNINLNYNFDSSFCEKLNMGSLGAYISVQNLYTFTSFPGTEVDTNSDPYSGVPQPRTWTLGIKASF